MSTTRRLVHASPEQVWEVLTDGWLYPLWVVGASHMRDVDPDWPAVGSQLHHSVGSWPVLINDTTQVLESEAKSRIKLRARAWPAGEAEVTIVLHPRGPETEVEIIEAPVSGPAKLIPGRLADPLLHQRNVEALRRLAHIVERRA